MTKGKIFNRQEVQAILSGNKRMFREVIKVQPPTYIKNVNFAGQGTWEWGNSGVYVEEPYQKGQKIFVKESFNIFAGQVTYEQNLTNAERYIWKPAQHMKQEQSRLTLQIKEIRVERLADISEEDAIAEGVVYPNTPVCCYRYQTHCCGDYEAENASWEFKQLWNATHKKPEEKFEANPWVWSIQFEVEND
jgi:hypothetical protein